MTRYQVAPGTICPVCDKSEIKPGYDKCSWCQTPIDKMDLPVVRVAREDETQTDGALEIKDVPCGFASELEEKVRKWWEGLWSNANAHLHDSKPHLQSFDKPLGYIPQKETPEEVPVTMGRARYSIEPVTIRLPSGESRKEPMVVYDDEPVEYRINGVEFGVDHGSDEEHNVHSYRDRSGTYHAIPESVRAEIRREVWEEVRSRYEKLPRSSGSEVHAWVFYKMKKESGE